MGNKTPWNHPLKSPKVDVHVQSEYAAPPHFHLQLTCPTWMRPMLSSSTASKAANHLIKARVKRYECLHAQNECVTQFSPF